MFQILIDLHWPRLSSNVTFYTIADYFGLFSFCISLVKFRIVLIEVLKKKVPPLYAIMFHYVGEVIFITY